MDRIDPESGPGHEPHPSHPTNGSAAARRRVLEPQEPPTWRGVKATEDEEDMLDLAFGLQKTSRLGCQLVMTAALDGLVVRMPENQH